MSGSPSHTETPAHQPSRPPLHSISLICEVLFSLFQKIFVAFPKTVSYNIFFVIRPPHTAAGSVLRNECPRTMSGGEPSSIKRTSHVPQGRRSRSCDTEGLFLSSRKGHVVCIRRCTASGGPNLLRCGRAGARHRNAAAAGRGGTALARLPFTGTRGTGKTTCAKILAKAVNCEHPENGNPATNAQAASASSPAAFSM